MDDLEQNWLPLGTIARMLDVEYGVMRYHAKHGSFPTQELGFFTMARLAEVRPAIFPAPAKGTRKKRTA